MFTKLLLVACVCIVVVLIIYFFYWNQFIAFVIGQLIRVLYWNQEGSSIWVEIGSIHFSLIAGRVLFKDFRYHSSNQTIKIVKGQLQWRYWIRRPTTEEEIGINATAGEEAKSWGWQGCRIQVSLEGFEWFMYNRTASFDNIVSQMELLNRSSSRFGEASRSKSRQDTASVTYPPTTTGRTSLRVPEIVRNAYRWVKNQLPNLDPKDLLPLGIDVTKGVIVLGNPSTPNLLVAEFQNAHGNFGVVSSRSKFDLYKQNLHLKFQNALIRYVENEDYIESMNDLGAILQDRIRRYNTSRSPSSYMPYRAFSRLWRQVRFFDLVIQYFSERKDQRAFQESLKAATRSKSGSKKVEDLETPIGIDFSTYEYAIERKILEAPSMELTYFVDVVGDVPPLPHSDPFSRGDIIDVGNGDTAPEWGINLVIHGGFIRYGPWADRQRAELQRAFFPSSYQDQVVTPRLKPGDKRLWTSLQMFIELRGDTTVHVPFREPSKDWQWDGKTSIPRRPKQREHASITMAVGDRSSINFVMPMVVGPQGYEPVIEIHLDAISMTSSLNDIKLISAESCRIRCEQPSFLQWNKERTWTYSVTLRQPVLYLLRDQVNMFTDLAKDWVSGPPTDYEKFMPMIYIVNLNLTRYEINLYANDHNIIDKPLLREDNALLIFRGLDLRSETTIASNKFRPPTTSVPFTIIAPKLSVDFSVPRWSTHALHAPKSGHSIAKIDVFKLSGSYRYYADVLEDNVDHLKLDFDLGQVALKAFGWAIRYFMVIKDNYFGSFTHFSTLNEYLEQRQNKAPLGDPLSLKYREGKNNMLQVELWLNIKQGMTIIPAGLLCYGTSAFGSDHRSSESKQDAGAGAALVTLFPRVQVHIRLHDYFMEMSINMGTIRGRIDDGLPEKVDYTQFAKRKNKELLFIDSLDIVANRLFGPLPSTATYLCIWEIAVGTIKASLNAHEAKVLAAAGKAFGMHFGDVVNAPAEDFAQRAEPDITFYKISVAAVELVWKAQIAALVVSLNEGVHFNSNDLAADQYRKVTSLQIPIITFKVLVTSSTKGASWLEAGEVVADAYLDIYDAPKDYRALNQAQTDYVQAQDRPTGRVRRMLAELKKRGKRNSAGNDKQFQTSENHAGTVFLPQPLLPAAPYRPKLRPIKRPRSTSRPQPSWALKKLGDLSDSDGDDALSEADRDAFVAKTRLSVSRATRVDYDEEGMYSGDESDDADLTDGDSLNSDWSDIADSPEAHPESAMMAFYSPLTRHYYCNEDDWLTSSTGSFFSLAREKSPLKGRQRTPDDNSEIFNSGPIGISEDAKNECNTTVFRIRAQRAWEVRLTPLLVVGCGCFEDDIAKIPSNPEMSIDSMMTSYLSSIKEVDNPTCMLLDIGLSSLSVSIFHHVRANEGTWSLDENLGSSPATHPSRLDNTAVIGFSIAHMDFSAGKLQEEFGFRGQIGNASCTVDISIDKRTLISSAPALTIFDASIRNLRPRLSDRTLSCHLEDARCKIGHRGPIVIAATAVSLLQTSNTLFKRLPTILREQDAVLRRSIHSILLASENKPIVDALSTIQPSFLVQAGTPWRLRSDPGFRLLFHLRSCIEGHMSPSLGEDVTPNAFLALLDTRLSTLDQDTIDMSQFPNLWAVFPGLPKIPSPDAKPPPPIPLLMVEMQLSKAWLTILDSLGSVASELKITDVHVNARKDKLELDQFASNLPTSMSQTSLRQKDPHQIRRFVVSADLGEINLAVFPPLTSFIQVILRAQKRYFPQRRQAEPVLEAPSIQTHKVINIVCLASLRRLRIRAAAENLVFELGLVGLQMSNAALILPFTVESSTNHAVLFDEIYLQARSPSDPDKERQQDILAAFSLQRGKGDYSFKESESFPAFSHRVVYSVDLIRVDVPRSALRLYRFAEEWQADYLPGIESTIKAMLSEIQKSPETKPTQDKQHSKASSSFHVSGSLNRIGVILQVMHGTWLTLDLEKIVGYVKSPANVSAPPTYTFGLQLGAINLNVSSGTLQDSASTASRVRLSLPPMSVAGNYDGQSVHTLALVEFVELKVKPSHWDTLLAVQQKFGQDFNDFFTLVQETRHRRPAPQPKKTPQRSVQYGAFVKMKGFRIGLEGLSSTLYLECADIRGGVNNASGLSWEIALTGLALSLAPRALSGLPYNRRQRSAFVSVDFKVTGSDNNSTETIVKTLDLSVTKIHAVMQASSIGEIGDFVDHLQAEMLDRQEQRAIELQAFKEKTQTILKTFDVKVGDVPLEETTSWLEDYVVNVSVQNIGVAFPLMHDHEFDVGRISRESAPIKAFLFTIRSISFKTNRGETGDAFMQKLCLQFVPRFRQSSPEDFSSDRHHARNCLVYPEMKAQLRSSTTASARKIWINAVVDGFILDLDSTIPDYVFSLIDVYRKGRERVERLSGTIPKTPSTVTATPKPYDKHYTDIPTSNIFASLRFSSGKVRAYSGSAIRQFRSRTLSLSTASQDLTDEQVLDLGAEVFNLPTVSVWAEYRATPASHKLSSDRDAEHQEPSLLMFKSTVHSSQNVLRPKLLPFLTEVINRVETRMRRISSISPQPSGPETPTLLENPSFSKPAASDAMSRLQLSFSLRIDRSRLELTCQPDVNVVAALNWESGGFMFNVSPGARQITLSGAVGGLAIGLKHGFLSEECVNLDARNLTFSIAFNKTEDGFGRTFNTVSAVLDTEFLGGVKFSRLQDILCFKAVWLDRIPVWNAYSPTDVKNSSKPMVIPSSPQINAGQDISTVILVRIRHIKLSVDLGQSISVTVLDLKNAVLRSKLTDTVQELSVSVEDVLISASGNLSGLIHVDDCMFRTTRRSERYLLRNEEETQALVLKMTSGPLIAILESDHQRLLHYRAEPLEVEIFDDWAATTEFEEERQLRLSFVVGCPEVVMVATIGTIPKIMGYINKFEGNLEAQRQGASRESKTYYSTRIPKPDNPLSAVAEAMLHSARSRFRGLDSGLGYIIQQHMSLRLDFLRLVVFPRSMNDVEIAQFVGRNVGAQFDRIVGSDANGSKRDLRLSFSSMTISKHSQNHPTLLSPAPLENFDARGWLEQIIADSAEATIIGLPAMDMHMVSEETVEEGSRMLPYDFKSQFIRQEGMKAYEDIFITLNMSLYAWLTLLRKNLAREMDQVRATEDFRSNVATLVTSGPAAAAAAGTSGAGRKRVPEPLDLSADEVISPVGASKAPGLGPSMFSGSISAPSTARLPSIDNASRASTMQAPSSAREGPVKFPASTAREGTQEMSPTSTGAALSNQRPAIVYRPQERHIERLTMRQLGEATPDVMHPFFMKKAGFNLEDSLPQYVHEFATIPLEEIMDVLLKIYSQQLLKERSDPPSARSESPDL
ncbi:hypothetical protein FA15DRAFT_334222 [Coprinopsis marcescibilis]|uniref:Csf1 N-terminal domain-containing protein n=1 Tax=Coprinopsis marcescibilis TaxID=230819 RepID=A0A5C3L0S7_COPMA|nr:hypothetical protein FA15DRAFT_334222 [Coprinopsis marcescibilis]